MELKIALRCRDFDPGTTEAAAPSGAHGIRLHCSRESAGWASHTAIFDVHHGRIHVGHTLMFIYLEDIDAGEGGLLVVPGSHKSNFDRTDDLAAHGLYGGRQEQRGSVVNRDAPGANEVPDGCVNVAPVKAGSAVIITEATSHGVLPYTGAPGRSRNMIAFGYEPQYTGSVPPLEPWMARLSEETKELLEYGHATHTKQIAMDWRRQAFLPTTASL
jgi:ectoine hydroxylase-related dioxygenase (phytanoyl-CoA dioxygenase family)